MFPPICKSKNESDYVTALQKLEDQASRSTYEYDKRIGSGFEISVVRRCTSPVPPLPPSHHWTGCRPKFLAPPERVLLPQKYRPPQRPIPSLPTSPIRAMSLGGRLHGGYGTWSQVFRVDSINGIPVAGVLIKLFHECLMPQPEWENSKFDREPLESASEMAQTEAWAYDRLIELQRNYIPNSLGFFLVRKLFLLSCPANHVCCCSVNCHGVKRSLAICSKKLVVFVQMSSSTIWMMLTCGESSILWYVDYLLN